ncbi:hypothetical protein D5086_032090 [Populus alba]|uniref:Uncharacterized protein n=1 Tax=Populus alba TaxID=43335 RepID=A0ACC4AKG2_POPAL
MLLPDPNLPSFAVPFMTPCHMTLPPEKGGAVGVEPEIQAVMGERIVDLVLDWVTWLPALASPMDHASRDRSQLYSLAHPAQI